MIHVLSIGAGVPVGPSALQGSENQVLVPDSSLGPVLVQSLEQPNTRAGFGEGVGAQHPQHVLMEHKELRPGLRTRKDWLKTPSIGDRCALGVAQEELQVCPGEQGWDGTGSWEC